MNFNHKKLIDLRWDRRWKQLELSGMLGVSASTVCMWEKGTRSPSGKLLVKLATVFRVEPGYFFD